MKKIILKKTFLTISILLFSWAFSQPKRITKIYTSYGGLWQSGTSTAPNPIRPDNSHNLLAFSWEGNTYSTGVDDAKLIANSIPFTAGIFKALPTTYNPATVSSSTFIGVGTQYGGNGDVTPVPVDNNLSKYLLDGSSGLDLGTAIFNLPASGQIVFDVSSINPASIGDGIPDLIVTQVGDISNVVDKFSFRRNNGTIVGNEYNVDFGTVTDLGWANWKFYNANVTPPVYNSGTSSNPARRIRLLALDWSELGLTTTNITQVANFTQIFSGQSDMAFTAYNTASITLKVPVSGQIFDDNDANVPNGNPMGNVTVQLQDVLGNVMQTTTTASNGFYQFNNVAGGQYHIVVVLPTGYQVVSNTTGSTNQNQLVVNVGTAASIENNIGINRPPVAVDDHLSVEVSIASTIEIPVNDWDYNGGIVIPSTISLIPPVGATGVVTDSDGDIVGFSLSGQGIWSVNQSGLLTFTPVAGYTGTVSDVKYTIKDNAGLKSNQAVIYIKIGGFCYKPELVTGTKLPTNQGISSLERAGSSNADNWPMARNGGWIALEAKSKGFVINRIPTTAGVNVIPNPVEGMAVYDMEAKCLKIYTTLNNGVSYSWRCYNIQSCPD